MGQELADRSGAVRASARGRSEAAIRMLQSRAAKGLRCLRTDGTIRQCIKIVVVQAASAFFGCVIRFPYYRPIRMCGIAFVLSNATEDIDEELRTLSTVIAPRGILQHRRIENSTRYLYMMLSRS